MKLPEKVKLVIWDLDETFWHGTLSEEGIDPILENINIVKELTFRGIINSISSKNNPKDVEKQLKILKIVDYFIFNKISWSPKGVLVFKTIKDMGLRPENCIFIDDNHLNIKEVEESCRGIYAYHPQDILPILLTLPSTIGKKDKDFSRLNQYKNLEKKVEDYKISNISNIDFLRKSGIQIEIDYDCNKHLIRILELIERTNQLNYTKKRIKNKSQEKQFLLLLEHYQTNAGVVICSDKYGSYGVIGFFLLRKENKIKGKLNHFVFSCRVINMGVESYIYDILGHPDIGIVEPVAYKIDTYAPADWIKEQKASHQIIHKPEGNTLLLGPCHLLQLSNFFQTDNVFFQYFRDGSLIKFDCPSFILAKREQVKRSKFVSSRVTWRLKEFDAFNVSLESADILIISFEDILSDNPYVIEDELLFRYEGNKKSSMKVVSLDINERAELLKKMIDSIIYRASPDANIYILDSVLTKNTPKYIKEVRLVYSHLLYKHYSHILEIIDMTSYKTIKGASIDDGVHLDRLAYRQLFLDIVNKDKKSIISDYSAFENNQYFASKYKKIRLALKRNIGDRSWLFRISKIVTKYLNV